MPSDNPNELNQLLKRLDHLQEQQENLRRELHSVRYEVLRMRGQAQTNTPPTPEAEPRQQRTTRPETPPQQQQRQRKKSRFSLKIPQGGLEEFIGGNLVSKIGIVILVIGVGIGAKYAIDNELISPLTRIVLGYGLGAVLLGLAFRLRSEYQNFSAVLLSGAMAILYFITFAAYDFYALIPQLVAFGLMLVFTAFTVAAAISYDRVVIAHIGLVGAYAVPVLLSDGSGKVLIFFSYISLINIGILVVAFKKYWRSLYYAAFLISWSIYLSWFALDYRYEKHFTIAFVFASLFFLTFYAIFLAYKLLKQEKFALRDVLSMLSNSFFFYGTGIALLRHYPSGEQLFGLFTVGNAVIHFLVSALIYRQKLGDRNLFYFTSGLVLVFITITIPVQLDGQWVTLLWAGEAAVLFWVGRSKQVVAYEKLAYPLVFLAFFSLLQDWEAVYYRSPPVLEAFFNLQLVSTILFTLAFGFMTFISTRYESSTANKFIALLYYAIPLFFLFGLYSILNNEIYLYWESQYWNTLVEGSSISTFNPDIPRFSVLWRLLYSALFLAGLAFANTRKFRHVGLGRLQFILTALVLLWFYGEGFRAMVSLQSSYNSPPFPELFEVGIMHILIRYMVFAALSTMIVMTYPYLSLFTEKRTAVIFDLVFHLTILVILSSELLNWTSMATADNQPYYRIGLSILWGAYALLVVALGIWKKHKHLRISAIALLGATLVKLFFYDISQLSGGVKTVVFVVLGALFLLISFLYNRYKDLITGSEEETSGQ